MLSFGVTDMGKTAGQEVRGSTKRMPADGINRLEPPATVRLSCVSVPDSNEYQAPKRLQPIAGATRQFAVCTK